MCPKTPQVYTRGVIQDIIKGIIKPEKKATSEEVLHAALRIDEIHKALCRIKNFGCDNTL